MNHTTTTVPLGTDTNTAVSAQLASTARPILFASYSWGTPTAALRRAHALARALRGDLHVLRVLPPGVSTNALFPQLNVIQALALSTATMRVVESSRDWCDSALPTPLRSGNIHVLAGSFVREVIGHAELLDAQLVVLPPIEGADGARVTRIARASTTPVLVARTPAPHDIIVAATDLGDRRYPVLRRATDLARHLDVPVVFVHDAGEETRGEVGTNDTLVNRMQQLNHAALSVEPDATTVVSRRGDAAECVLSEARAREADIVVVGTRPRSWFDRLLDGGIAARIVETAKRSVLVTPMVAIREFAR